MARGVRLAGATVLITGGGSGIGRVMALDAARRGARVVVWDLDEASGRRVVDTIREHGGSAHAHTVDVGNRDGVEGAAADTLADVGHLDVLINNAGIVTGRRLLEAEPEQIEKVFAVNTLALYWVTRAFLPSMERRERATVVTIASAAGLLGVARQTDYSASKFAAVGFAESLRAELRRDGSSVGSLVVCPYYIDTGMFDGVRTRVPLLLPILREDDVARRVLDAVERGRSQLVMPPLVRALPVMRVLPPRAVDAIADLLGVNRTMDHFTGRG